MKKTRYWIIAAIIILMIGLFAVTRCQEGAEQVTGQAVSGLQEDSGSDDGQYSGNATNEPVETDENYGDQVDDGYGQAYATTPACDETNCEAPGMCYQGRCKVPECITHADCANDDPCLPDVCEFAGHPNAFCSINVITGWKNNDGCCPVGATIDKDIDCAPVCGNHHCEFGEHTADCPEDCKNEGTGSDSTAPSDDGGDDGGDNGYPT